MAPSQPQAGNQQHLDGHMAVTRQTSHRRNGALLTARPATPSLSARPRCRNGVMPYLSLPYAAVLALWGIDISTGWYGKSVLPEPIELRVVLELVGEPGSGAGEGAGEGAGAGAGGAVAGGAVAGGAGAAAGGVHGQVFTGVVVCFTRPVKVQHACLSTTVSGCPDLGRALVGLVRQGVRRLGDGTVALVMTRAPAAAADAAVKEEKVEDGRQVCSSGGLRRGGGGGGGCRVTVGRIACARPGPWLQMRQTGRAMLTPSYASRWRRREPLLTTMGSPAQAGPGRSWTCRPCATSGRGRAPSPRSPSRPRRCRWEATDMLTC